MTMVRICLELEQMWRTYPAQLEDVEVVVQELSSMHESVQCDIHTLSAFAACLSPSAEKDLGASLGALQRLAGSIKYEEEQRRADGERRSRSINLEMAQRSIAESRSTIACESPTGNSAVQNLANHR